MPRELKLQTLMDLKMGNEVRTLFGVDIFKLVMPTFELPNGEIDTEVMEKAREERAEILSRMATAQNLTRVIQNDITIYDKNAKPGEFSEKLMDYMAEHFVRVDDSLKIISFGRDQEFALNKFFLKGCVVTSLDEAYYKSRDIMIKGYNGVRIDYEVHPSIVDNKDVKGILGALNKVYAGIAYGQKRVALFVY